ncbi:LexA/Signal peptidase [Ramaria rubella]|nr:LexA/Signal peptidase [Ramaria rubella]
MASRRVLLLHRLGWIPVVVVFNNYFYTLKTVTGRSMQPTFNPDSSSWRDIALFDRTVAANGYKCERGDVVSLRSPISPKTLLLKRIIALEGDMVQTLPPYPEHTVTIPKGYVWIEGDERFHSEDSNHFGPVPLALINAKLTFIVWPLSRFGPPRSTPIDERNSPAYSPAWRENNNDIARERWRTARVQMAGDESNSASTDMHEDRE